MSAPGVFPSGRDSMLEKKKNDLPAGNHSLSTWEGIRSTTSTKRIYRVTEHDLTYIHTYTYISGSDSSRPYIGGLPSAMEYVEAIRRILSERQRLYIRTCMYNTLSFFFFFFFLPVYHDTLVIYMYINHSDRESLKKKKKTPQSRPRPPYNTISTNTCTLHQHTGTCVA